MGSRISQSQDCSDEEITEVRSANFKNDRFSKRVRRCNSNIYNKSQYSNNGLSETEEFPHCDQRTARENYSRKKFENKNYQRKLVTASNSSLKSMGDFEHHNRRNETNIFNDFRLPRLNREYNSGISNQNLYKMDNSLVQIPRRETRHNTDFMQEYVNFKHNQPNFEKVSQMKNSQGMMKVGLKNVSLSSLPFVPLLTSLLEHLDTEMASSTTKLQGASNAIVDMSSLVERRTSARNILSLKSKEGSISVQDILSKMHNHITQAHKFCNMLHRVDESLQTFSRASCTVHNLERD